MSHLEDVRKKIEELTESRGPDTAGRDTLMPPKEPIQPIDDEGEQPKPNLPKGPAGY